MATYRPEFLEALRLLGDACGDVVRAGYKSPILVGGAAVEFYTGGAVTSGDFDVVTAAQEEFERALIKRGFQRPGGPGVLLRGLLHPTLKIGVEVVSGALFDGAAEETRVHLVSVGSGEVAFPPVEDMIADRIGQYCANPAGHSEMLEQAIILYQIATSGVENSVDREYLNRRIRHETSGAYDLSFLAEAANEPGHSRPSS